MTNPNETTPATPAAEPTILIGDMKWSQVLPILIAALEDGTPTGVRMAKDHLSQMAAAADLAGMAMDVLMRAADRGLDLEGDMQSAISQARRINASRGH